MWKKRSSTHENKTDSNAYGQQSQFEKGREFESQAKEYLMGQGYRFLQSNFLARRGELDLVFEDPGHGCRATRGILVFVEVRGRSSDEGPVTPLETVSPKKILSLKRAARWYLESYGGNCSEMRFDFVGIEKGKIVHVRDAW